LKEKLVVPKRFLLRPIATPQETLFIINLLAPTAACEIILRTNLIWWRNFDKAFVDNLICIILCLLNFLQVYSSIGRGTQPVILYYRKLYRKAQNRDIKMPYGTEIPMKNAGRYMEQFVKVVVPKGSQGTYQNSMAMAGIGGYNNGGAIWKANAANHGTSSSSSKSSPWNSSSDKK
jgi:hypothetical protein